MVTDIDVFACPVMFYLDEDKSYRKTKGTRDTFIFKWQPPLLLLKNVAEILAPSYIHFKRDF